MLRKQENSMQTPVQYSTEGTAVGARVLPEPNAEEYTEGVVGGGG